MKKINFASIDIGGTNVRFALFKNNKIVEKFRFATDVNYYEQTLDKIIDLAKNFDVKAIALCIPGPANYEKGIILSSPNLIGWNGVNVKNYLLNNSDIEYAVFENDANVMALANHHYFKNDAKGVTQFFTISTGFGAGLIIENKIFRGSNGLGQEIAQAPLAKSKTERFHLNPYAAELFVSGTGMTLRASIVGDEIEAKDILAMYKTNSEMRKIVSGTIETLARAIAISIAFMNPNLMVFGGSVATHNYWFVEKAIEKAKKLCDTNQFNAVRFEMDKMGDDSALFGLNILIREHINSKK